MKQKYTRCALIAAVVAAALILVVVMMVPNVFAHYPIGIPLLIGIVALIGTVAGIRVSWL